MATLSTHLISLPRHLPNLPSPTATNDIHFSSDPPLSSIDHCTSFKQLKQVHPRYACQVFDQIPQPNLYSWNTLILAYASSTDPTESILVLLEMLYCCVESPNKFTYPFVIKAASELRVLKLRRGFHGMVIKASLGSDVDILNSLVHFYGSCEDLDFAWWVFVKTTKKDVVSWNSMITAFAQGNCPEEALELFKEMKEENVKPNDGECVVSLRKEGGFGVWDTTMLDGYVQTGNYDEAWWVFAAMPGQDIAAWNVLISSYEQSDKPKEALAIFMTCRKGRARNLTKSL
ncbi:hypothetical protein ACFX13_006123 [Malus domestica]